MWWAKSNPDLIGIGLTELQNSCRAKAHPAHPLAASLIVLHCHFEAVLSLIGMRGDTFISLSFSNEILSAEFLSKRSKLLGRKNYQSSYFDTLSSL